MESEVTLDLFICFLEKQGVKDIGLKKEIAGLGAFGKAVGYFKGEEIRGKDLEKLIIWTRENGYLKFTPLLFMEDEWSELGNCLWDKTITGKSKEALCFGSTWKTIINTLREMKAESKVAAAAVQAMPQQETALPSPLPSRLNRFSAFFGFGSVRPVKGRKGKQCISVAELLKTQESVICD